MSMFANNKLLAVAVGAAVLAGAGGAVAATQSSGGGPGQAYVNDLANRLGVSSSTLTTAMKAALEDQVNAAVAAGRITQAQADTLKQRIESSTGLPFIRRGWRGLGGLRSRLWLGARAASQYLGIARATLRSDLQSGKSLAQIADSTPGKSAAGLKAAILAAAKSRLDAAVSSGRITAAEETQRLDTLSSTLDVALQRTLSGGPFNGPRGILGLAM